MDRNEQSRVPDVGAANGADYKAAFENGKTQMLLLFLGLAILFAAYCDWVIGGIPLSLHLVYIAAWTLVLLPLAGWRPSRNNRLNGLILISFATIVLMLYFAPSKREQFLRDFDQLKPGMTRAEVETIMSKYALGGEQADSDQSIFRHTLRGSSSADMGVVTYANDRVTTVEFLSD